MSYGPFCRPESPGQRREDALRQVSSGEIWGLAHTANPDHPRVRAYPRRLHAGERGITFTTSVAPEARFSAPHEARWSFPESPGVRQRTAADGKQVAAIAALVNNLQP